MAAPRSEARPIRASKKVEPVEALFDGRTIAVRGAREHNLKNVDLTIPRDKLVVFTGLSGSGNPRSRSTRSMPRASVAMSSCSRPTRASSSK